jgi:hypothetical protein
MIEKRTMKPGPVISSINEQRPASGTSSMIFHHENAKPHVAECIKGNLKRDKCKIVRRHPPFSSGLAPSDLCLYDFIKRNLNGNH